MDVLPSAEHADTVDAAAGLGPVVVDEPDRLVAVMRIVEHVAHDLGAGVARSVDQHALTTASRLEVAIDTITQPGAAHDEDQHQRIDQDDRSRIWDSSEGL